jgi:hypothetical protein
LRERPDDTSATATAPAGEMVLIPPVQKLILRLKDKKMVLNSDTFLIFQEGVFLLKTTDYTDCADFSRW